MLYLIAKKYDVFYVLANLKRVHLLKMYFNSSDFCNRIFRGVYMKGVSIMVDAFK